MRGREKEKEIWRVNGNRIIIVNEYTYKDFGIHEGTR